MTKKKRDSITKPVYISKSFDFSNGSCKYLKIGLAMFGLLILFALSNMYILKTGCEIAKSETPYKSLSWEGTGLEMYNLDNTIYISCKKGTEWITCKQIIKEQFFCNLNDKTFSMNFTEIRDYFKEVYCSTLVVIG